MSELAMDIPLPTLREDLILHSGPRERDGSPTWTLYDPATNRYFRLGWLEFECLTRFKEGASLTDIVKSVNESTTLEITEEDLLPIIRFFDANEMVQTDQPRGTAALLQRQKSIHRTWFQKLFHSYLFFVLPLVRPSSFLRKTLPVVRPLFSRSFFLSVLALLAFGLMLTFNRLDEYFNTFGYFFSWDGLFFYLLALIGLKIIHELGHAYAATLAGVKVSSMGVAFIVLYPVLFTETTGAWKVAERKPRILIGAAGIMAELCVAALALMFWHILPDGPLRGTAFFISTISIAGSLLINLNPLMRFDGYYLLTDILGIDNLQYRAFTLAKWHLRHTLFGWIEGKPEEFSSKMEKTLLLYAYCTWIYRFFLFIGIALLIHHFFFQPLGLLMMAAELYYFIALPIGREIFAWWKGRAHMQFKHQSKRTIAILLILSFWAFVPWKTTIDVPAVLKPARHEALYSPIPARITDISVTLRKEYKKGDILISLEAPSLDHNIAIAEKELLKLQEQQRQSARDPELYRERQIIEQEIQETRAKLTGLREQEERLIIRMPFNGTLTYKMPDLHEGRWINQTDKLLEASHGGIVHLEGYVTEDNLQFLKENASGRFYADNGLVQPFFIQVTGISDSRVHALPYPLLASIYEGPIPVEENADRSQLIPHKSTYAIHMGSAKELPLSSHIVSGHVRLKGQRVSLAGKTFRSIAAMIIRETGF